MYLECDSNNKVIMRNFDSRVSGVIKETKIVYKDNRLVITGLFDSISVKNRVISEKVMRLVMVEKQLNIYAIENARLKEENVILQHKVKLRGRWLFGISLFVIFIVAQVDEVD
jgi:hypothetical protein